MEILQDIETSKPVECPYLPGKSFVQEYFFARDMSEGDFKSYLDRGWRRFGMFFFRPVCPGCQECKPIRIPVKHFKASKSQRRNFQRGKDLVFRVQPVQEVGDLKLVMEAFSLYRKHSLDKFGKDDGSLPTFLDHFYRSGVPSLQCEYYLDDRLVAAGFLDVSEDALSSVYFFYDTDFSSLGLGTYSVLREIEYARSIGKDYYNLGYYIEECSRMSYKGRFKPHELMDWESGEWSLEPS